MSVVLMWGHCLRHRPFIKQHMSAGRVAHRKRLRHRPPHLTETCVRVELMVSQRRRQRANIKKTFFEKLINIQYLNLPPYPNRWMVWLIQQGLAWRPRCVKTCCQEDVLVLLLCKAETQYLTCKVTRYRLLAMHGGSAYIDFDFRPDKNLTAACLDFLGPVHDHTVRDHWSIQMSNTG